jgi:hypothetical protein
MSGPPLTRSRHAGLANPVARCVAKTGRNQRDTGDNLRRRHPRSASKQGLANAFGIPWDARRPSHNPEVAGSNPAPATS